MTLKELSKQYYDDVENLTEQINRLNEAAKYLSGAKLHTANRHLVCLREMRRDARLTAETLEHYYDRSAVQKYYHRRPKEV